MVVGLHVGVVATCSIEGYRRMTLVEKKEPLAMAALTSNATLATDHQWVIHQWVLNQQSIAVDYVL